MNKWFFILILAALGCQYPQRTIRDRAGTLVSGAASASETLAVLSVTGGLCMVAGMGSLVGTGGRKGWYPVVGGIILVVLNYVVARYSDYLFYPLVACTALISAAWTYKIIKQILLEKKSK